MSICLFKIVCVGCSYVDYVKELGNVIFDCFVLFIKLLSSLFSLDVGIFWNFVWGSCYYECELVLCIDYCLSKVVDLV